MKIQLNTDSAVSGSDALKASIEADLGTALERYAGRLTRVEVHLGDVDGSKDSGGADKRCLLEARPSGMEPVVVTALSDTVEQAFHDATRKMVSLLDSTFGRIDQRDANATIRHNEPS